MNDIDIEMADAILVSNNMRAVIAANGELPDQDTVDSLIEAVAAAAWHGNSVVAGLTDACADFGVKLTSALFDDVLDRGMGRYRSWEAQS